MWVRQDVFDAIEAHARRDSPFECCGLLLGTPGAIVESVPARNVAADPLKSYEIAPEDHFSLLRRCRQSPEGVAIVGGYHSHPRSHPIPSPTDLEKAFEEFVYLIAGPVDNSARFAIRGYRLSGNTFSPLPLRMNVGEQPLDP